MPGKPTLGVIIGNRSFFPDKLVDEGRTRLLAVLDQQGIDAVALAPEDSAFGGVETLADARKCAALFRERADDLDGVIVSLPNFGDEKAVANALRWADLDVPVLVQAFPDDVDRLDLPNRRDAFCGKISVCSNLTQYGIPFTLTDQHTVAPDTTVFTRELDRFLAVCRVVKGLRGARVGAIGARTGPFNTVRYSEKILEGEGISVETLDLSELLLMINALGDADDAVEACAKRIRDYAPMENVTDAAVLQMARLLAALEAWVSDVEVDALTLQCWTAIESHLKIVPCGVMSLLSESLLPTACEVDVMGALSMMALQLAAQQPSAIVDWNNNYGEDPDCCVLFHCSNLPRSAFRRMHLGVQDIIAQDIGPENACGTCVGVMRGGPVTFARLSTDDTIGEIVGYVGEAEVIADEPKSFGGCGAARVPDLQGLLQFICRNGFEHHVSVNYATVADALEEAFSTYMGWDIYRHS